MADALEFAAAVEVLKQQMIAALPIVVSSAAALVMNEISSRAPVDTGALRAHVGEVETTGGTYASATVQVGDSAEGGIEHYAIYVEFGTSHMPARPFFRPGVEASRTAVLAFLEDEFTKVITP